jgi:hypothetical protein
MTQRDLNREVAHATGETVETIERMGFGPLAEAPREPMSIDWDEMDELRGVVSMVRSRRLSAVA